mmetsp:Transcript_1516/g.3297  ORF Transcript_1516/g.3297 Transcript_1516/m.3297 type:complete len:303 (-) Transcript_1516:20-928(-)
MNVKEVGRLVGVIVHPIHGRPELEDTVVHVRFLVGVDVPGHPGLGNVLLAPGAQLLHAQAGVVPVVAVELLHLLGREEVIRFVVHVKEVRLAVGTAHSDGIEADVAGHLGGIEVTYEPPSQFWGKLHPRHSGDVLDPPGARLGKAVHCEEPSFGLVDEQHQEEGEEASQDANVGLLEKRGRFRNVVQRVGRDANADVDGHGEPHEEVMLEFMEAGSINEEKDFPEWQLGPEEYLATVLLDGFELLEGGTHLLHDLLLFRAAIFFERILRDVDGSGCRLHDEASGRHDDEMLCSSWAGRGPRK